ncbi:hypothetical protein PRIPAC_72415 [Pristionchus pacificus]|uniref:Uncharacterized protein n=1 Tax=Pristionchus pacificus TaxID=54126 RepID=A0A2A6D051_PRIPA|nr:hypothetical protein PRIPAC_72415 [Pristionchus pacificus]|eukprot:PDM83854.1 hypothetical protein PRIPAC_30341 [Pristionchus pacificus]
MFRSILNAIAEKFNYSTSSRRAISTTTILLERDPAGNEAKNETPAPEWAKTTVDVKCTVVDETPKETVVVEQKVEMKQDTLEETIVKLRPEEESGSSIERSRENSLNSSRAFHEQDQKFGERIADDALVTFCDRLRTASEKKNGSIKFEGWLPINNVLIFARMVAAKKELEKAKRKNDKKAVKALESELGGSAESQKEIEKAVTGKHRVIQSALCLFDSLLDVDHPKRSLKNISDQITAVFGHLYEERIPIWIPISYEQQTDDWSCGYRAIACVLNLVRRWPVLKTSYNVENIHTLLIDCLDSSEVSYEAFQSANTSKQIPKGKDDEEEDDDEEEIFYIDISRDKNYDSDDNNNEEKKEEET